MELKSTILGGRVLRARTPAGAEQEIYALLVTYQALRIAISDASSLPSPAGAWFVRWRSLSDSISNCCARLCRAMR